MRAWFSPRPPDPRAAQPLIGVLPAGQDRPPLYVRMLDERGYPPWLRPAPSMRLLQRPRPDPYPLRIRYAPALAGRFTGTPPRHYG